MWTPAILRAESLQFCEGAYQPRGNPAPGPQEQLGISGLLQRPCGRECMGWYLECREVTEAPSMPSLPLLSRHLIYIGWPTNKRRAFRKTVRIVIFVMFRASSAAVGHSDPSRSSRPSRKPHADWAAPDQLLGPRHSHACGNRSVPCTMEPSL